MVDPLQQAPGGPVVGAGVDQEQSLGAVTVSKERDTPVGGSPPDAKARNQLRHGQDRFAVHEQEPPSSLAAEGNHFAVDQGAWVDRRVILDPAA